MRGGRGLQTCNLLQRGYGTKNLIVFALVVCRLLWSSIVCIEVSNLSTHLLTNHQAVVKLEKEKKIVSVLHPSMFKNLKVNILQFALHFSKFY